MQGCIAALGVDDPAQVRQCCREVAFFAEGHAQVEVRGQASGFEREGLSEHLDGLLDVTALRERRPEVRVRSRVLRVERDRLPQRGDALGKVGPVEQRHAEPVVGVGGIGGHLGGVLQPLERAGTVSALEIGHAERDVDLRIVGVLGECLLQRRHGVCLIGGRRRLCGRDPLRPRLLGLTRGARGTQQDGDGRGGKPTLTHWSGSSRRNCKRDDASSSWRRVLA